MNRPNLNTLPLARVVLEISQDEHHALKTKALAAKQTLKDYVLERIAVAEINQDLLSALKRLTDFTDEIGAGASDPSAKPQRVPMTSQEEISLARDAIAKAESRWPRETNAAATPADRST